MIKNISINVIISLLLILQIVFKNSKYLKVEDDSIRYYETGIEETLKYSSSLKKIKFYNISQVTEY